MTQIKRQLSGDELSLHLHEFVQHPSEKKNITMRTAGIKVNQQHKNSVLFEGLNLNDIKEEKFNRSK